MGILLLVCLLFSIKIPGIEKISLLSKLPIGRGAAMAWFILPLAAWAGILLLRPGMPDAKRLVLFWVGTGLLITLMVELVVVQGDIGRMNTVFKFYLHVWALFALSAAAALGWLFEPVARWLPGWRIPWRIVFGFLVFSAALFTLYGSMAKIKDRWVTTAPHTLDGMAYMPYATYVEDYPSGYSSRSQCTHHPQYGFKPGLPRHPLDAGKRPGFTGDRGSQLAQLISLVFAFHHQYGSAWRGRLGVASTTTTRPQPT